MDNKREQGCEDSLLKFFERSVVEEWRSERLKGREKRVMGIGKICLGFSTGR